MRRIFQSCLDGYGPTQIARQLKAEKIPTRTEHWNSIGRKCSHLPEVPCAWNAAGVADILLRQEYCGDTINFRSTTKSFKNKTKIERPEEEWQVFPDTHPAIIDRETFALVQKLRSHRRRPTRTGHVSMFSGLLYCADCGSKLYYSNGNVKRHISPNFFCSSFRKETSNCTAHYIREKAVYDLVLAIMQRVFRYVRLFEDPFIARQREQFGIEQKRDRNAKKRALEKAKSRVKEIDGLIQRLYEDNVKGKLSDERYATLSSSLETEQKELKARLPEIEADLNRQADQEEGLQRFVSKAKQITNLKELTPELVHEFIEKIVVHAPKYLDGNRFQLVDIYFYGVGIIKELEPEEMEAKFQKALKQEKSA